MVRQELACLVEVVRQALNTEQSASQEGSMKQAVEVLTTHSVNENVDLSTFGSLEQLCGVSGLALFDATFEVAIVSVRASKGLFTPRALRWVADGSKGCPIMFRS